MSHGKKCQPVILSCFVLVNGCSLLRSKCRVLKAIKQAMPAFIVIIRWSLGSSFEQLFTLIISVALGWQQVAIQPCLVLNHLSPSLTEPVNH